MHNDTQLTAAQPGCHQGRRAIRPGRTEVSFFPSALEGYIQRQADLTVPCLAYEHVHERTKSMPTSEFYTPMIDMLNVATN